MKQHYEGDTPVLTLNCEVCQEEFEIYGLTIQQCEELARIRPETKYCGWCDPE